MIKSNKTYGFTEKKCRFLNDKEKIKQKSEQRDCEVERNRKKKTYIHNTHMYIRKHQHKVTKSFQINSFSLSKYLYELFSL